MARRAGIRIEEMPAAAFEPMTNRDLRKIRAFMGGIEGVEMDRETLMRIMLDRERLAFVAAAAVEWRGFLDDAAALEGEIGSSQDPDTTRRLVAASRERAEALLRHALQQLSGAGKSSIVGGLRRLAILFVRGQTGAA